MLFFSLSFSLGSDAPSFFGQNIFIVKTDKFLEVADISKGEAVISEKVDFREIQAGNTVIYQNSEKQSGLAVIHTSSLSEGVYSFTAESDRGTAIILSQGQIVGKVTKQDKILGLLISFAMSPSGVLVMAIMPCGLVVVFEFIKYISAKTAAAKSVRPVKKQDEIPTFIPRQKNAAVIDAYTSNLPSQDDYDMEEEIRRRGPAFKASELMGIDEPSANRAPPLYQSGKRKESEVKASEKPIKTYPVSQKRLNEVIAETKKEQILKRGIALSDSAANINVISDSAALKEPEIPTVVAAPPVFSENKAAKNVGRPADTPPSASEATPLQLRSARSANAAIPSVENSPRIVPSKTAEIDNVKVFPAAKTDNVKVFSYSNNERGRLFPSKKQPPASNATSSIPRLDQILSGEQENDSARYNIEDILSSLEKRS
ncbi:MAG: hypothetical protein LBR74_06480 [Eubacterium sp.]|nr:hypothetical protein [Eubacterium sp.]